MSANLRTSSEHERRIRDRMNKCVHFNGIVNDECRAGVVYKQFSGSLPCFRDRDGGGVCGKSSFPTETEAAEMVAQSNARMKARFDLLASGRCPECKVAVRQTQVGPCVYGSCGHRLYQGKVNPEFAAVERRPHSSRRRS